MALDGVVALHISTTGMDAHTWVVFAIVLGPALVMMVVVALRSRQDAREADLEDGATLRPESRTP